MTKSSWPIIGGLLIVSSIAGAEAQSTASLLLVPMPREVTFAQGTARLFSSDPADSRWTPDVQTMSPEDEQTIRLLEESTASDRTFIARDAAGSKKIMLSTATLSGSEPRLLREQGYVLQIEPNHITISAGSALGRFYGTQTLRQLVQASKNGEVPCMTIRDWPDIEWRGVSDDISRGQVSTIDDFRQIIRQLAYYKKNLYQPYIEDMFQFDTDPNIGADRGAVTKREMQLMVEEGRKYHILVNPVFECLGHQDRLLGLPENRQYAELQGAEEKPWSFAPVKPEALQFVTKLLDEIVDATPDSPFFHIGGDESWDVGKGLSKARADQIGIGRLHAEWFTKLHDHLASRGRKTLLYGDMLLNHPEALEVLPKDTIIIDWHYDPKGPFPSVQKIRSMGFAGVFTSPGLWSWSTFYPNYRSGFANIANLTAAGREAGAVGSICSSWGDNGAENLRVNNMAGFAYSAATEWETTAPARDEFLRRFVVQQYGVDEPIIADTIAFLGWGLPEGINSWNNLLHQNIRIKPAKSELVASMGSILTQCDEVIAQLERVQMKMLGTPAGKQLEPLRHCLSRVHYLANRIVLLDKIARQLAAPSVQGSKIDQKEIESDLKGLTAELNGIICEYQSLWLQYNKYPKLDDNLARLQGQLAQLQGFVVAAEAGELEAYPPMQGVWFWYPEANPQSAATTGTKYFLRELELADEPAKAQLRLFVDDKGRAFINGRGVAEAEFGTGSADRDVNVQLKKGRNILAVQATNEWGAAGVLFSLSIKLKNGQALEVTGDDQWRCTDVKQDTAAWRTAPADQSWKPAKVLGKAPLAPWNDID